MPPTSKCYDVVILGAGGVAQNLAHALVGAGHRLIQIHSRTETKAMQLASAVGCNHTASLAHINPFAHIYLLAVPDRAIDEVVKAMPALKGIIAHTSGSTPLSALDGRQEPRGVLYPFQTFTPGRPVSLKDVPVCIEASDTQTYSTLEQLAHSMGSKCIPMDSETRKWLHLEGVFCCNFINHMLAIGERIAHQKGFSPEVLKPLIIETIQKAVGIGALNGQTGPAVRGDNQTMERHMELLKGFDPKVAELYLTVSESIMALHSRGN